MARRYRELEQIVTRSKALRGSIDDLAVAREMLTDASGDDREMLAAEISTASPRRGVVGIQASSESMTRRAVGFRHPAWLRPGVREGRASK